MINWQYFPASDRATPLAMSVVAAFESEAIQIDSSTFDLPSNEVLAKVGLHLAGAGLTVELGKKARSEDQSTCIVWA